jgi:pimeloyl-ACP methyl ester carboxylesterase
MVCVLGLGAGMQPGNVHGATPAFAPTFTPARCLFTVGSGLTEGQDVECGYVTVPESYSTPDNGKTVQIAVARFSGSDNANNSDAVISLQGGPGGGWINTLGPYITSKTAPTIVGKRDLILVDQRGTGFSQPSLACPEITGLTYTYIETYETPEQSAKIYDQGVQQCHTRLVREGINLSDYTTTADAADIDMVRQAFGLKTVNLYGVSYGTELASVIMRNFPQHIRSVVLDSVDPVQGNQQVDGNTSFLHALNTLFSGCAADPRCKAAYPNLQGEFYALVAKLNAKPATIIVTTPSGGIYHVPIAGDDFANLIINAMYVTSFISALPETIDQAAKGNFRFAEIIYDAVEFDDSISWGVYYSVECSEDGAPYSTPADFQKVIQKFPQPLQHGQLVSALDLFNACKIWNVKLVPSSYKLPVTSTIPTLLLAGQYDPVTPLSNAQEVASTLSHSYVVFFPGDGHGQAIFNPNACPVQIMFAFYDHPEQKPNTSCAASMSGGGFLAP